MPKTLKNQPERTSRYFAVPARKEVAFILSSPEAEEVYLCGDFNEWVPDGLPMIRHAEDRWWRNA